jgi:hypothetical protein
MRRSALLLVVAVIVASGCVAHHETATNCGSAYTLHSASGTVIIGSCAGTLSVNTAAKLQMSVGEMFTLSPVREPSGASDFGVARSTDPDVVGLEKNDAKGAATYRARSAGSATLTIGSIFCTDGPTGTPAAGNRPAIRECPVVKVIVRAA